MPRAAGFPKTNLAEWMFAGLCAVWVGARGLAMAGRLTGVDWAAQFGLVDQALGYLIPIICVGAAVHWRGGPDATHRVPVFALAGTLAATFLMFDLGKALHTEEMLAFFRSSGWPAELHWAVMLGEVTAALVLLGRPVSRFASVASLGLGLIMVGAVYTHMRNGDPLDASADAFRQLLFVACFQLLNPVLFRGRATSVSGERPFGSP